MKSKHVLGAFKTVNGADTATERLVQAGIPRTDISVLVSDQAREQLATIQKHTRAAEGAAVGGIAGGILGSLIAGLTTVAALAVPGVGVLAAGPLVAALAGAGAGAAAGGTLGGLIGLGLTEHEAKFYAKALKEHGMVVVVSTDDARTHSTARTVLDEAGALKIESSTGQAARI